MFNFGNGKTVIDLRIPTRQWLPSRSVSARLQQFGGHSRTKEALHCSERPGINLWNARTNFTPKAKVDRRFRALRCTIYKLKLY